MYKHFFKRLLDILISLIALPFVFLTIIIFGPIIFFTDRGPIFYCGKRIGKNGKPFKMIKFRSMKVNAPDIRLEDGSTYNGENDPRVTKIGKFLRKTSIDELPQFLNVFIGQMSLIGPRPDPLDWLDKYPEDIKVFLTVRPGITGYSQAYFRNSADGYEKMQNDAYYAKNLSFWLDVKVFFKTLGTVFKHENTYKDTTNEEKALQEAENIEKNNMAIKEYGYEYDAELDKRLFDETFGQNTEDKYRGAYCLRSGRDALKAIAREYNDAVVLIPALACDSMVLPFKMYGHKIVFYKLNKDLEIELDSLHSFLKENSAKTILFLYMDYFGIKSIQDNQLTNISKNFENVVFINDITHVFLTFNQEKSFEADYTIASLRKWINVPDGGLLWCKKGLKNTEFANDISFAYKRLEAQQLRHSFFETGNQEQKKEYRKIFSEASDVLDSNSIPARMTKYSFELIKRTNFNEIFKIRQNNAKALINVLKTSTKIVILQNDVTLSNLYVPFLIDNRDSKQQELNKLGIFNTIIWPLSEMQMNECSNSKYIVTHMLAAPCDQRYTAKDMEYIGKEIVRIVNE